MLDKVRSVSGISGLYSGLGWSTIARISGMGARFGIYELLTAFCKDGREDNYVYVNEALLAGIAAGAIEALVSTPFELFKVRSQASLALGLPTSRSARVVQSTTPVSKLLRGYTPEKKVLEHSAELLSALPAKHYNMVEGLRNYPWMMTGSRRPPLVTDLKGPLDIISLEGWWSLWRSLRSTMARDSIFCGVFFSSWQYFHLSILNQNSAHMDPPPRDIEDSGPVPPLMVSLAAGFSGSVAAAASHCFDTAKSRHDCSVLPKYITMEWKFLGWKLPGSWPERVTGIFPVDRISLFHGIGLRMARSGFSSFLIVGGYLLAVDHLF
ncbi:hypothetical protein QJS10_CPB11g02372 [Acorus calamus]|uniref:Uncharacterized protein n=1 Tax=Acorus calamus TaxID=4465 RepID=A0AAV9DWG4_ACOCL|nr:hypothetical protein QJS10_CPB11g02372 [Acorus calamus]